jgi:hypothetical protein
MVVAKGKGDNGADAGTKGKPDGDADPGTKDGNAGQGTQKSASGKAQGGEDETSDAAETPTWGQRARQGGNFAVETGADMAMGYGAEKGIQKAEERAQGEGSGAGGDSASKGDAGATSVDADSVGSGTTDLAPPEDEEKTQGERDAERRVHRRSQTHDSVEA